MPTNVTAGTMLHPSCGLGGLVLQDPSPHMAVELTKQAASFRGFLECRSATDVWRNLTAVTSGHLLLLRVELYHRRLCALRETVFIRMLEDRIMAAMSSIVRAV